MLNLRLDANDVAVTSVLLGVDAEDVIQAMGGSCDECGRPIKRGSHGVCGHCRRSEEE